MNLQFTKPKQNSPTFEYGEPTETFATAHPRVRDPYEIKTSFVNTSGIPYIGEGLFAKVFSMFLTYFVPFTKFQ